MKTTVSLLLALLFSITSSRSIAQASKTSDILTASQLIKLLSANTDETEDILPPSFVKIEPGTANRKYRRDYRGTTYNARPGELDYDMFLIKHTALSVATTDSSTYKKYKTKLESYGFQWQNKHGRYTYNRGGKSIWMYIDTIKNAYKNVVYMISLIPQ